MGPPGLEPGLRREAEADFKSAAFAKFRHDPQYAVPIEFPWESFAWCPSAAHFASGSVSAGGPGRSAAAPGR